jgi:hypothetical protein
LEANESTEVIDQGALLRTACASSSGLAGQYCSLKETFIFSPSPSITNLGQLGHLLGDHEAFCQVLFLKSYWGRRDDPSCFQAGPSFLS